VKIITKYTKFLETINTKDIKKISVDITLPNDIIEVSNAYIKAGKDIFLVGGAVRDFIQGKEPKDWDLVTNALPEESKEILKDFKLSDEQGKNFGVLRLYTKDEPEGYEIASYRKDISKGRDTKGDDQKVEMGKHITIFDDCMRRDLTMNALFYDIKNKQIVDIVGGVDDIKNGVVRAVGNAMERFIEDRLRICRIFRFAARTGGKIDGNTAKAIRTDNRLKGISPTDDVSQERIWEEFKKAWKQAIDFNDYLNFFTEFDMWEQVFPGSKINTELVESKDFVVVMANLFKNESTKGLEDKLVQEYKIPNSPESGKIATQMVFLINMLNLTIDEVPEMYKKKVQCSIKDTTILEWLDVNSINDPVKIKFTEFKPSVSSKELMDRGITGRELGVEIKRLEIENFKKLL
jgi:tRNA nucleotidyltransferase/poly(A) polymerase